MQTTKLVLAVWLLAGGSVCATAQQIKLPDIYAGQDISAVTSTNIHAMVQPAQLKPVAPEATILEEQTPRLIKPTCIPHGPFAFVQFEAQRQNDGTVKLAFETENEYTSRTLTIERVLAAGTENADITQPADSSFALFAQAGRITAFAKADSQYAKNRGYHKTRYEVADNNGFTGITFYRVTASHYDDTANTITQIIAVIGRPLKETVSILPNPATTQANVQVYSKYACGGILQLISTQGGVDRQQTVALNKGINNITVAVQGLSSGIYYVKILRTAHTTLLNKLVKI